MERTERSRFRTPGDQQRSPRSRSRSVLVIQPHPDPERGWRFAPDPRRPKFRKDIYTLHPNVEHRTKEAIDAWMAKEHITVNGSDLPRPVWSFEEANFTETVTQQLKKSGFLAPTATQALGWPIALSGRNLVGVACTGSGKTLSYLLPALMHVYAQPPLRHGEGPIVLVLTPTRELAKQILAVAREICSDLIKAAIVGGGPKDELRKKLKGGVEMVIATPGRLLDHITAGDLNMNRCSFLVIDEADCMLSSGFLHLIRSIVAHLEPDRQTIMWSATWPSGVQDLADELLTDYVQLNVGSTNLAANPSIHQTVEVCFESEKEKKLVNVLRKLNPNKDNKVIIFAETLERANKVTRRLEREGYPVVSFHRGKPGVERDYIMERFRKGKAHLVVATDLLARGVDVDVGCVINYDFPSSIGMYVHRVGRTGRTKHCSGTSYSFFTSRNSYLASALISLLNETKQNVCPKLVELAVREKGIYDPLVMWIDRDPKMDRYSSTPEPIPETSYYQHRVDRARHRSQDRRAWDSQERRRTYFRSRSPFSHSSQLDSSASSVRASYLSHFDQYGERRRHFSRYQCGYPPPSLESASRLALEGKPQVRSLVQVVTPAPQQALSRPEAVPDSISLKSESMRSGDSSFQKRQGPRSVIIKVSESSPAKIEEETPASKKRHQSRWREPSPASQAHSKDGLPKPKEKSPLLFSAAGPSEPRDNSANSKNPLSISGNERSAYRSRASISEDSEPISTKSYNSIVESQKNRQCRRKRKCQKRKHQSRKDKKKKHKRKKKTKDLPDTDEPPKRTVTMMRKEDTAFGNHRVFFVPRSRGSSCGTSD